MALMMKLRSVVCVREEPLGHRRAPRSVGAFEGAVYDAFEAGVEAIGVRPMLVHELPGVHPIVEDLGAVDMAADAPDVAVARGPQVFMSDHEVVDVVDLECHVIEAVARAALDQQHMVIDILRALVEAIERKNQVSLRIEYL